MLAVGVVYLLFEKSILADAESSKDELSTSAADGLSRAIVGVQVSVCSRRAFKILTRYRLGSLHWQ